MLKNILFILHIVIIIFGFLGFLLPKELLIFHLFYWPSIIIQWLINKDKCVVSQLEKSATESDGKKNKYKHFSTRIYNFIGFDLDEDVREDRRQVKYMNMTIFSISWIISLIRYIYL